MTTQTTQARNPDPERQLRQLIASDAMKKQMALALPKHLTPDRMARCALTALLKNPTLLKADQSSFTLALMNLAQWGLEPDGRRAHLVPFWNSKANRFDVVAIPDYKGLVELVLDGGNVSGVHCSEVCEYDDFEYNMGQIVRHKIDFQKPRGDVYAYYALVTMKEGSPKAEVMSLEEVQKIRDASQGWRAFMAKKVSSSVWNDFPHEMGKKTVFKRASKWVKLGQRAQMAVEADDAVESRGATPTISMEMLPAPQPESWVGGLLARPQAIGVVLLPHQLENVSDAAPVGPFLDDVPDRALVVVAVRVRRLAFA